MSENVREFIWQMQQKESPAAAAASSQLEDFALWLLDQHTVETGTIQDLGGQDDVTYCGSCGQDLDGVAACDHVLRLARLWDWHPDYRSEDWEPVADHE